LGSNYGSATNQYRVVEQSPLLQLGFRFRTATTEAKVEV
jgi:hypothetical protein